MKKDFSKDYYRLKENVENQSALQELLENLKKKIDNHQATPEVWLSIFMLEFANMEGYLKSIVKMILIDITKKKNIILNIDEFSDLTFGRTIDMFEDLFLKGKYIFRGNNKIRLEVSLNLQKAGSVESKTSFLFSIPYLKKYISRLRWFNRFRNNLYHNLFTYDKGKNINQIIAMIQKIIDLDSLPFGTYNSYEFDLRYYDELKKKTGFDKTVELKRKSLLSTNSSFPPDEYASINMVLRIIFYHYSFIFMGLREGIHY